jgi:hypothetical protein
MATDPWIGSSCWHEQPRRMPGLILWIEVGWSTGRCTYFGWVVEYSDVAYSGVNYSGPNHSVLCSNSAVETSLLGS